MMYHIPDVLSADQVAEFTRQLAQAEWVDGRVTVGSQGAAVKQNQQIDTRTPLYARLQAAVLDALRGHPQFFSAALPRTISAPLFNRYGPGETYGFHVDGAVRQNGEAGWMRTDLSATLFLCEPESYEGGELVIEDLWPAPGEAPGRASGALSRQQPALRHPGHPRRTSGLFPVDPVDGPRR